MWRSPRRSCWEAFLPGLQERHRKPLRHRLQSPSTWRRGPLRHLLPPHRVCLLYIAPLLLRSLLNPQGWSTLAIGWSSTNRVLYLPRLHVLQLLVTSVLLICKGVAIMLCEHPGLPQSAAETTTLPPKGSRREALTSFAQAPCSGEILVPAAVAVVSVVEVLADRVTLLISSFAMVGVASELGVSCRWRRAGRWPPGPALA